MRRCVQKSTGLEFAAKIINTKKLSARGKLSDLYITYLGFILGAVIKGLQAGAGREALGPGSRLLLAGEARGALPAQRVPTYQPCLSQSITSHLP